MDSKDYIQIYGPDITFLTLIGWQAYRGDQIHRKNSPTEPRNQIQVKHEKHLPGL